MGCNGAEVRVVAGESLKLQSLQFGEQRQHAVEEGIQIPGNHNIFVTFPDNTLQIRWTLGQETLTQFRGCGLVLRAEASWEVEGGEFLVEQQLQHLALQLHVLVVHLSGFLLFLLDFSLQLNQLLPQVFSCRVN